MSGTCLHGENGRAEYYPITDKEAVDSFVYLSRMEGIIPAIESSHAIALAMKNCTYNEKR